MAHAHKTKFTHIREKHQKKFKRLHDRHIDDIRKNNGPIVDVCAEESAEIKSKWVHNVSLLLFRIPIIIIIIIIIIIDTMDLPLSNQKTDNMWKTKRKKQ